MSKLVLLSSGRVGDEDPSNHLKPKRLSRTGANLVYGRLAYWVKTVSFSLVL